jgi:hypothetical protein
MKATSAANHASVLSLLEQGYSVRDIERRTGLGKSTVGRIKKEVDTDKENNLGGRPSKLSARDKTSIIRQIQSGKLDNAVQATHFINSTLLHPVHPQTKGTSGEWFTVCYKEESAHVEKVTSSEAAGVCTTT